MTILVGDCRDTLRTIADASVNCVVTSPPYFAQRDYGVEGQIGLEAHPDLFVQELVAIFRECRRVLRDDGVLWLNIGDGYNNRTKIRSSSHEPKLNGFTDTHWRDEAKAGRVRMSIRDGDLKEKDLFGVPWMVAFALRSDGWFLRQETIWHKPFGKPDDAPDRCGKGHEQIFLFSKSKRYHFDKTQLPEWARRTVWNVPPNSDALGHAAPFPPKLIEPCILAGCPEDGIVLDPFFGAGTSGLVAERFGRKWIGCELNANYAEIARERIRAARNPVSQTVPHSETEPANLLI